MKRYVLNSIAIAAAGVLTVGLAASALAADKWPSKPITIIAAAKAGGSYDRIARGLAPFLSKELGVPVNVVNKGGSAGYKAVLNFLKQPADGNTLMVFAPAPYSATHMVKMKAKYKLSDFDILNVQWPDYSSILLHKDQPYKNAKELFDAIRKNPGKLSIGMKIGSAEIVNYLLLMQALKLPADSVRVVTFVGGAKTRAGLSGGVVNFGIDGFSVASKLAQFVKPLATFTDKQIDKNVPTVNEALGVKLPLVPSSARALILDSKVGKKHPKRRAKILAAYKKIMHDPAFLAKMKKGKVVTEWLGPKESRKFINVAFDKVMKSQKLVMQLQKKK